MNAPVNSGFGPRISPTTGKPSFHEGVDIAAARGSSIGAAADGVVRFSGWQSGYGNTIIVEHADGWATLYGHMDSPSPLTPGTVVRSGDTIGRVGSSGNSTGNHLHWETRQNGRAVDPSLYIDGRQGPTNPGGGTVTPGGGTGQPGTPSSGPGSSPSQPSDKIENRQPTDVKIGNPWGAYQAYDADDTPREFIEAPFVHPPQAYYAAAELWIGGEVICPLKPEGRVFGHFEDERPLGTEVDDETKGVDLRLMEFQHRDIAQGGATSLFRLFIKSWKDVVKIAELCSGSAVARYRFGYTNFQNVRTEGGGAIMPGMRDWQDAIVLSFTPEFLENGYYVSLELHDTASFGSSYAGARTVSWRVIGGRVSDLVIHLCNLNGWKCCVEPTEPNKEHIVYQQFNKTDLNFIIGDLRAKATSEVKRPWIQEGTGQSSYKAFFVNNVLHFHPMCPDPNSVAAKVNRTYIWGGVHDADKRILGTVLSFKPDFNPTFFQVLGAGKMRNRSSNPLTKEVNTVEGSGTNVKDTIMGSGRETVEHQVSTPTRARSASSPHQDIALVRRQLANRFYTMRELCFAGSVSIMGDPWLKPPMMINIMTVRPIDGVMLFYDWLVTETIHTIVGGEFHTTANLTRYRIGPRDASEAKLPGGGVGMGLYETMTVQDEVIPYKVGQTFDKYGTK